MGRPRLGMAIRRTRGRVLGALVASVVVAGCAAGASPTSRGGGDGIELLAAKASRVPGSAAEAQSAAAATNAFGFELYRKAESGNLVISPASVAIALSMARPGAVGETGRQMDAVLHQLATDGHAGWIGSLDQSLAAIPGKFTGPDGKEHEVALRIANASFGQSGYTFSPAYLDALASRFGDGLRLVDYRKDASAARQLINAWVSDQTEKRIPELLAPGLLTPMTRLVLVNAIYLKAPWLMQFHASATAPSAFTTADGSQVDVPTMHQTEAMPYASGDGWQAVELRYAGSRLALTLIEPSNLAAFESGLTAARFDEVVSSLETRSVALAMPKFKIETKTDLNPPLKALGMPLAFEPDVADFSGITTEEKLYISHVIHQANIDVDENGTTASAATAVAIEATGLAAEPVELHLDHPFLFALRDTQTGAILFLGRVADPS